MFSFPLMAQRQISSSKGNRRKDSSQKILEALYLWNDQTVNLFVRPTNVKWLTFVLDDIMNFFENKKLFWNTDSAQY